MTTWNPSDNSDATLSNGNLTATFQTTASTWHSIRSTTSKSSGKWHFEITIHPTDNTNDGWMIGVGDSSFLLTNYCGQDAHGIGLEPEQATFQNGAVLHLFSAFNGNDGDVIAVEVDVGGTQIWWNNITQGSGWTGTSNNSFTGVPSTGTQGQSYTATNPVFIGVSGFFGGGTVANQLILNPGPTFAGTVSSGFSPWDAASIFRVDDTPSFPVQRKFRPLRQVVEEQWPFTATPNPLKLQGIYYDPQFPIRRRFRTFQSADEQWPFTAVKTPTQFGWDNPEKFPLRKRFRTFQSTDEQWPFTAVPTPTQFGWDNPEKFPLRKRFRTFQSPDEQWPFTAVPTPTQFGWDNPERFPLRKRFRTFQSTDEQWPFTAVPTPTQLGFFFPDPPPVRLRPRQLALSSKQDEQWPFIIIQQQIFVPYDTQFPIRARFRPYQSNDEQWTFTAVLTPTQTGFLTQDPTPVIRRPQQLALMSKEDEQWLLSAVGPTTLEGAWYVDQTFPPVTAENPGAWFSPHAWFIKVI